MGETPGEQPQFTVKEILEEDNRRMLWRYENEK